MGKSKVASLLAVMIMITAVLASSFGTYEVSAAKSTKTTNNAESKELVEISKVKAEISLIGGYGLFELMKTDVEKWAVNANVKVLIVNNSDKTLTFSGSIGEITDKTHVTIAPGKKKYITFTMTDYVGNIVQGSCLTEKQALKLLNGNSASVKTKSIEADLSAADELGHGIGYLHLTIAGGSVDTAYEYRNN